MFYCVEPFGALIRANPNINGIQIPLSFESSKIYQHADDTTVTVRDKASIAIIHNTINLLAKASNARINREKSEILKLNSLCPEDMIEEYLLLMIKSNFRCLS